jgi:hypothetical protein
MVEATPAASLVMPKANLLLELLIVALNTPSQLGGVDQIAEREFLGKVESQYLVGSSSPSGHSISSHSLVFLPGRSWLDAT